MSEVISEQDAAARKEQDVATIREQRLRQEGLLQEAGGAWIALEGTFENGEAAASFLNTDPAQGPGEAMTTVLDNGRVAVIWYLRP